MGATARKTPASSPRSGPASPRSPISPVSAASPPANVGALEADPNAHGDEREDGDADSFITTGVNSDSTSVSSSIFKFREENGRTYHAYKANEADYFLPNDDRENERLDLQHNLFLLTFDNQMYLCPAGKDKPVRRTLDVGTGTGIWAMEYADEHPETTVVGVDLSPIQPEFVPPNVEFFVDDLESDWTFVNPFDFIYMRCLTGSIRNWPKLIGQAFQHLNPGGYLEICDPMFMVCDDGTLSEDCPLSQWACHMMDASAKLGAGFDGGSKYKQYLIDAGFEDVVEVTYKWPINTWPKDTKHKEIGAWNLENVESGLQAMSMMLLTKVLGWSVSEVELFLVSVRKDLRNRSIHAYCPVTVVYGRKPE